MLPSSIESHPRYSFRRKPSSSPSAAVKLLGEVAASASTSAPTSAIQTRSNCSRHSVDTASITRLPSFNTLFASSVGSSTNVTRAVENQQQPLSKKRSFPSTVSKKRKQLVPTDAPNRAVKRPCKVPGCTKGAQSRGKCKAHGGGSRCTVPGCGKSSQGSGLCRAHGGGKKCSVEGCEKGIQRAGKCHTHGGKRSCKYPGCKKKDRGGGTCAQHKGML